MSDPSMPVAVPAHARLDRATTEGRDVAAVRVHASPAVSDLTGLTESNQGLAVRSYSRGDLAEAVQLSLHHANNRDDRSIHPPLPFAWSP